MFWRAYPEGTTDIFFLKSQVHTGWINFINEIVPWKSENLKSAAMRELSHPVFPQCKPVEVQEGSRINNMKPT